MGHVARRGVTKSGGIDGGVAPPRKYEEMRARAIQNRSHEAQKIRGGGNQIHSSNSTAIGESIDEMANGVANVQVD